MHDFKSMVVRTGVKDLQDSISAWLNSGEGRQKVEASLQQSQQSVKSLNQARTVDPKILQEPVTLF